MKKTALDKLFSLAEKFAHQVNGQWHVEPQLGYYDAESGGVAGVGGVDPTKSNAPPVYGWHTHPHGDYYAEPCADPNQ